MRRFVLIGLLASLGSSAIASFELLLVGDNGANTLATRKIHRFEARTGTYLGSFGGFSGTIVGSWLRQSTNSLFVQEAGAGASVTEWDYNTGALKSVWGVFAGSFRLTVRPDGQRYALFDGFNNFLVGTYPGGMVDSTTGDLSGAFYQAGLWHEQNRILAYDNAGNGRFVNVNMNAAGTLGTATANSTQIFTPGFGQMAINAGTNSIVMAAGSRVKQVEKNTLSAGEFASPFGTSKAAAAAHNGFFIGGSNGSSGLITYYDRNTNIRAQFGSGVLVDPVTMETVLAPEPGTILALGAGLAVILRRRRRK